MDVTLFTEDTEPGISCSVPLPRWLHTSLPLPFLHPRSLSGDPEPARLDPGCLATAGDLFLWRLVESHLKSPGPWEKFDPTLFTPISPGGQTQGGLLFPGWEADYLGVVVLTLPWIPGATLSPPLPSRIPEAFARLNPGCVWGAVDSRSPP